jgi:lysophospholipase L1-like esterase
MTPRRVRRTLLLGSLLLALCASSAQGAGAQQHWVATWAASAQAARIVFPGMPQPSAASNSSNQGNRPPLFPPPPSFDSQTVRMIVRSSIGGSRVRVQLSNAFGPAALHVGAAHVALQEKDSAIVASSDRVLTFSGQPSVVIPAGAEVLSDPVDLSVPPLTYLAVSVYVFGKAEDPTDHLTGLHTTYISGTGDFAGAQSIAGATTRESWYWLSAVDVLAPARTGVIVAFGDSITDGATSTPDTDRSWPGELAERLETDKATAGKWSVVNEGISGNRLLNDGMGVAALSRLDRDVFSLTGVKWMIVMLGINDIGFASLPGVPTSQVVTAQDLIAAQKQIIERAHLRGIRVIGATLTPYEGATYFSEKGEVAREAVNNWIRTGHAYDAVIDFDKVVRDPANPKQIRSSFNISDHLHPNDEGYKAMADAVDLSMFSSAKGKAPQSH